MESILVTKGEQIYARNRERWEKDYLDKIIAIEIESGNHSWRGWGFRGGIRGGAQQIPRQTILFQAGKLGPVRPHLIFTFRCRFSHENQVPERGSNYQHQSWGARRKRRIWSLLRQGAGRTLVPERDAAKLGLEHVGGSGSLLTVRKDM